MRSPSIVAMEACYYSHYWARLFESFGHQVKLLPANYVKPFVRGNKNDHNDALAIGQASQRTSLTNQTRGLLSEYGIVFAQGYKAFKQTLEKLLKTQFNRTITIRNDLVCI